MVNSFVPEYGYRKLTFIKSNEEELRQLHNTVLMKIIADTYKNFIPLGDALTKTQYGYTTSAKLDGNSKLLRITDITEGVIDWPSVPFCDCKELKKYSLNEEDILITRTGGTTGKTVFIKNIPTNCVFASYLIRLTVNASFNPEYIYLFLNSYLFWNQILEMKNGTAQPNVNAEKMKQLMFPACSVDVQNKIVHYKNTGELSRSEILHTAKLKFNRVKNINCLRQLFKDEVETQEALLYNLRQSVLQEAIEGKLTAQWRKENPKLISGENHASKLLERIKAEKERLIKEGKIKKEKPLSPITNEEKPFELPEGWEWCRLGDLCSKIGSGSTPKGSNYSTKGILFFRSQNIHDDGLDCDDIKFISSEVHKQMKGTAVIAGDLLLNITGGSLGRCALIPVDFREGNVSQHVCIIRSILMSKGFMHKIVLSPQFQKVMFESTTGAGREGLPKYNLEQFVVPVPSVIEQQVIVNLVDKFTIMVGELDKQVAERKDHSEMLMRAVLREAFERT
ncbi:MAG: restriction endonuclease subunit S [Candidatus Omnitrophota bacterium]